MHGGAVEGAEATPTPQQRAVLERYLKPGALRLNQPLEVSRPSLADGRAWRWHSGQRKVSLRGSPDGCDAFRCDTCAAPFEGVGHGIQQDSNGNLAVKLLRTFTAQTEALQRYRGKGQQKVIVKHVHVHTGAQAIVGSVSQAGSATSGARSEMPYPARSARSTLL
jgi:hypothetical protein